ncbi:MAG: hypothetical protein L6R48_07175 [Planctomycetes bacterium]|nr:hypothetical protein [Planctomycetota bacterium]
MRTTTLMIAMTSFALVAAEPAPYAGDEGPLQAVPLVRPPGEALVDPGQTWTARIPVENRSDIHQQGVMTLTLLDLWERPCGPEQRVPIDLPPVGRTEIKADFLAPRLGVFKVRAVMESQRKLRARDVASFGCVPAGIPPRHPFLGAHINMGDGLPALGRRLGFSGNRSHDMTQFTWWSRLEPERGQWDLRQVKTGEFLASLGYENWGEWMATPHWAHTLPDGSHPPRHDGYPKPWRPTDAAAFTAYVRTTLELYPQITRWEVWNEPNVSGFWAGSPQDYAELAKLAYAEAKRVRPTVQVFVQFGADGPWYRDAAKAGLLTHCDGVSFHAYASTKDHPQTAAATVTAIRALLAQFGRPDLPLVNSEGGLSGGSFLRGLVHAKLPAEAEHDYDFMAAAERLVQWRVVQMAAGVQAHYYYMHVGGGIDRDAGHRWSLVDAAGGPTPAGVAQNQLAWQLDGGAFRQQVERSGDVRVLRTYLFARGDGSTAAVLWAEDGASYRLKRSGAAFDLMGNPLADDTLTVAATPLYLRLPGAPDAAAASLAAIVPEVLTAPKARSVHREGAPEPKPQASFPVANELGLKRLIPLDLAAAANMGLADDKAGDGSGGWLDEGPYNDLSMIAQGRHEWLGVPMQIGSAGGTRPCLVTMKGKTFPGGPAQSSPIPVGRKARGLFFCHGANWSWKAGITAATYVVAYDDGTSAELPVVTGQNLGDWWRDQQDGEDGRTVAFLCKDPLETKSPYRFLRMWYWENPKAEVPITTITVKAGSGEVTFALVGITAAVW